MRIKQIDSTLPLPQFETPGSVGFDILARIAMVIKPHTIGRIPGNIIVEVPRGYMLLIASRSSTPGRKGLLTPHGIGVIDQDYHGPDDEVLVQVYNFTDKEVNVARGEKIAQGIFIPIAKFQWNVIHTHLKTTSRGGFGSTTNKLKVKS